MRTSIALLPFALPSLLGAQGVPPGPAATDTIGTRYSAVSAGGMFACALTADGHAQCWGLNTSGQLGVDDRRQSTRPVPVGGTVRFVAITAGSAHVCGLAADSTAWCWGSDDSGQLGAGARSGRCRIAGQEGIAPYVDEAGRQASEPTRCSPLPLPVEGGLRYRSLEAGWVHTCGVTTDGTAVCWGILEHAELLLGVRSPAAARHTGTGVQRCVLMAVLTPCVRTPNAVGTGVRFASITAGVDHTCALTQDGRAFCWGVNTSGELGTGARDTLLHDLPTPVTGAQTFRALTAGRFHTCGLAPDGGAWCWGRSDLDFGWRTSAEPSPVQGFRFVAISAGQGYTCGVTDAGAGYCAGTNEYFQLGTGQSLPAGGGPVAGNLTFRQISAGWTLACGLTVDDAVYCWGHDDYGQLGQGRLLGAVPGTREMGSTRPRRLVEPEQPRRRP